MSSTNSSSLGDLLFDLFGSHALLVVDVVDELVLLGNVVCGEAAGRLDDAVALGVQLLEVGCQLVAQLVQVLLTRLGVNRGDDGAGKVQDLLEILRGDVEQVAQTARAALEVPDVADGSGELDVAHALAAHLGARNLDTAALADDALEAHALVLAARAFPIAGRAEDFLAEQAVLLGLEGTVVDGLGLLHLTARPAADILCGREGNANGVEVCDVVFSRH